MRILHILDHSIPLHSGYTFRSRAIIEQQRTMGWETRHITSGKHKGAQAAEETVDGLIFYRTPEVTGLWTWPLLNQLGIIRALEQRLTAVVAQEQPDILHAHSPALNGIAALRVSRRFQIPLVYECRAFWEDAAVDHGTSRENGLRYRLTHALETYVFRHAAAITTICEGLRDDIIRRGIAANKVTVIPNAVDMTHFSAQAAINTELADTLGLTGQSVIGFIGSFYAYEGLDVLLRALPHVLARQPDIRLLLVGGGPEDERLKQLAVQLNVSEQVIFTGRVPHSEVKDYYNLVDLFVYPRLSMRLTDLVTPLKPLEAMAQNKLVVASDVGGHRELIRDGENGRLFAAGDNTALADTVLEVLQDRSRWPALREAGYRYVASERNWPNSVGRYADIYQRVIQSTV